MSNGKRYVTVAAYDMNLDNGGEGGTPVAIVSLRVLEGPDMGSNLTYRGYLSEKAAPFTMQALKALGWTGTKLSKAMAEGLGTRKATAQLKMEEYKGKVEEKVGGIYEYKPFGVKNPIDNLDAFDALFADVAASAQAPETELSDKNKVTELPPAIVKAPAPKDVNPNSLDF